MLLLHFGTQRFSDGLNHQARLPPHFMSVVRLVRHPTSLALNLSMYLINSKQIKLYQSCFIVHLRCLVSGLQYFCLEEYLKYYYCHIGEYRSVFLTVTLVQLGVFSARPWWLSHRLPLSRRVKCSRKGRGHWVSPEFVQCLAFSLPALQPQPCRFTGGR